MNRGRMRRNLIVVLSEGVFQVHWLDESKCRGYIGPVEFTAVLRESSLRRRSERTACPISVAHSQKLAWPGPKAAARQMLATCSEDEAGATKSSWYCMSVICTEAR